VLAGLIWWGRWAQAKDLPTGHNVPVFLLIVLAGLISTTVHEFGHASAGCAFGMKVRAFIVGPFEWRIQ
jgi:hypothetical protein